jgi:cytochrome c oxidase cbb3-type subunit 3
MKAYLFGIGIIVITGAGCEREQRALVEQPPSSQQAESVQVSDLAPGPEHAKPTPVANTAERNAWAMSEGQQLYNAYNCVGCHAHGGGGMGPALMDEKWIYGSQPEQVYATIVEGRPNGMPSFRGKIPDYQIWELVAYVRSMSGLADQSSANGRDDHMKGPPPPASVPTGTPHHAAIPKSAEQPK